MFLTSRLRVASRERGRGQVGKGSGWSSRGESSKSRGHCLRAQSDTKIPKLMLIGIRPSLQGHPRLPFRASKNHARSILSITSSFIIHHPSSITVLITEHIVLCHCTATGIADLAAQAHKMGVDTGNKLTRSAANICFRCI